MYHNSQCIVGFDKVGTYEDLISMKTGMQINSDREFVCIIFVQY